jgi:hypothetical protein
VLNEPAVPSERISVTLRRIGRVVPLVDAVWEEASNGFPALNGLGQLSNDVALLASLLR